jgi:hypothetical protein
MREHVGVGREEAMETLAAWERGLEEGSGL